MTPAAVRLSRRQKLMLWGFVVTLLLPGAIGFVDKLGMFFRVLFSSVDGGYTLVPILNYLLIAAGLLCLFVWAVTQGMFRNIEAPKYEHLEREAALDREDGIFWEQSP